ncbi:MAG TPA: hypothetical protein VEB63_07640 [Chitinophagaceae bacterium]|nr:hypothetical protein [Chitinophagaceae bacterium]
MKFIKLALLSAVFLFLVITLFSLFIPSRVRISKATEIRASRDSLWARIGDPTAWATWNRLDASRSIHWLRRDRDEHVAEIPVRGSRGVVSGWQVIGEENSGPITLQWYMDFRLRWYPWEKFRSLLFEKTYGHQMEESLTSLKSQLEK